MSINCPTPSSARSYREITAAGGIETGVQPTRIADDIWWESVAL